MLPNFSITNRKEKITIFLFLKIIFKFVMKKLLLLKLKSNYKKFQTNFVNILP